MDLFNKGRKWHLECEVYSLKGIKMEMQLSNRSLKNVIEKFMLLNKWKEILEAD
jgi:hypothetical protein